MDAYYRRYHVDTHPNHAADLSLVRVLILAVGMNLRQSPKLIRYGQQGNQDDPLYTRMICKMNGSFTLSKLPQRLKIQKESQQHSDWMS